MMLDPQQYKNFISAIVKRFGFAHLPANLGATEFILLNNMSLPLQEK